MNILVLYDQNSTHTNTVFEHLDAFRQYSKNRFFYSHASQKTPHVDLKYFDAIIIHYSLRLAYQRLTTKFYNQVKNFTGLKILFAQDEYDFTNTLINAIHDLKIKIFYTCVPKKNINLIYPKSLFKNVEFVNTLTGYIPNNNDLEKEEVIQIKKRKVLIGYRGNKISYSYGDLPQEKILIAKTMKNECSKRNIPCNISVDNSDRIYGKKWIKFLKSSKVTLATESGSNLFDYDGKYKKKFSNYLNKFPNADYDSAKLSVLGSSREKKIMNQISPRIFEAIACKTVLVLFEGNYSGILRKDIHYIALKKNFSNINDVFNKLRDDSYLQRMADRTFDDIVRSEKYSYREFVESIDRKIDSYIRISNLKNSPEQNFINYDINNQPNRINSIFFIMFINKLIPISVMNLFPKPIKRCVKNIITKIYDS
jgi:hypothetical protein